MGKSQLNNYSKIGILCSKRSILFFKKEDGLLDFGLNEYYKINPPLFINQSNKGVLNLLGIEAVKVNYQKFKEVLVPIKGLEKEE